jgi:hypothetical protein
MIIILNDTQTWQGAILSDTTELGVGRNVVMQGDITGINLYSYVRINGDVHYTKPIDQSGAFLIVDSIDYSNGTITLVEPHALTNTSFLMANYSIMGLTNYTALQNMQFSLQRLFTDTLSWLNTSVNVTLEAGSTRLLPYNNNSTKINGYQSKQFIEYYNNINIICRQTSVSSTSVDYFINDLEIGTDTRIIYAGAYGILSIESAVAVDGEKVNCAIGYNSDHPVSSSTLGLVAQGYGWYDSSGTWNYNTTGFTDTDPKKFAYVVFTDEELVGTTIETKLKSEVFTMQLNQTIGIRTRLIPDLHLENLVELPDYNVTVKIKGHNFSEGYTVLGQNKILQINDEL